MTNEIEKPQSIEALVTRLTAETVNIKTRAVAIVVSSDVAEKDAIEFASDLKKRLNEIETNRKTFLAPLKKVMDNVNATLKPFTTELEEAEGIIKSKILQWRTEREKLRQEEERKRQEEYEAQQKKQAEEFPLDVKEEAIAPLPLMAQSNTVVSETGAKATGKKVWDFEIEDEAKVPRGYLMLDEKGVRNAIRTGIRTIPGLKIYQKETLSIG